MKDILSKTSNLEFDTNYISYWANKDAIELDKKITDAIVKATDEKNADGDEITEEERESIRKRERHK